MGAHGMKAFAERFPDRSFNVGVAEANMAGVAAGLAAAGKIPFIHSFATFATRRCFDQIAISICYAKLNVRIIGSDPGVGAELNGGTHMALEDVGIMRTLPGMTIFEPVDSVQLKVALPALTYREGPVYMRLFRKAAESVFQEGYQFKPGSADVLRDGADVTIIASGVCVSEALTAAGKLDESGIKARVLNIHTVKPIDTESVLQAAAETGAIVTAENHSIIGGLGSAVAEVLAEERPTPLVRVGVRDRFGEVGKQDYLMRTFGITAADIANAARKAVQRKA
jgi:transketolase